VKELSLDQKSPVFVQKALPCTTELHPKAFTMAVRDQQFIGSTSTITGQQQECVRVCKITVDTGSETKELESTHFVKQTTKPHFSN